ncbi:histone deacetylase [Synechococcales cyanobacterium C]|uniref:Histone deacetylase n=1 Tax=Petrachloros mirabilis ULC683 TaxID=2781853 RepID=A0A8K2ANF8_9CYAN|nr:histone deacetylase [Petrachloros mirabilis]NCJ05763.1 histone deacetylase [Petrachloros mirabilis ULC683]
MLPILYSEKFLEHQTGQGHPERPQRLSAIVKALHLAPWVDQLQWQLPTPVAQRNPLPMIEQLHDRSYVERLYQFAAAGGGFLDPDTVVSAQSYEVALLAVNAWLDGVDRAVADSGPALVLARPPGHHALRDRAMGFCLLSNAAIAAHYALGQVERVAILDWDVHHGNGTQALVETHPQICYCSLHQASGYPGTGLAQEQGQHHNVLNLPLPGGSTLAEYEQAFTTQVLPFLQAHRPDLLIVSAGYDANATDPLADMALLPPDFGVLTRFCLQVTPRMVLGLEGGYHLQALAQSVVATVAACLTFEGG